MHQELTKKAAEGFLLVGRIDAPENPKACAVIVHGLCEHYGRYDYVVEQLLAAGYAVVRFDHRGHGRSMGKAVWYDNRQQIVADTDLFVEEARAHFPDLPLFMIGHSMGGFGAASYATTYPGKLDGYVLSGAWTRDHAGLAAGVVEQGLDPPTSPTSWATAYARTPPWAKRTWPIRSSSKSSPLRCCAPCTTATYGSASTLRISPTRCFCCTAAMTA